MIRKPLATHHDLSPEVGISIVATPDLEHLRFAVIRLAGNQVIEYKTGDDEVLLVKLEGEPQIIECNSRTFELPSRTSVFTEGPSAVYAPPRTTLRLHGPLLAGAYLAESGPEPPEPYLIAANDVPTVTRGTGNFRRDVRDILPADKPATRLLVGETINPPGNWSSSPPHKHDVDLPPSESALEEIYLYRFDPQRGFGFQGSYQSDPHEAKAFEVRDLDIVSIPAGYHPVVAGPGYGLYYLWGLAGSGRELLWSPDPDHAWVDTP